MTSGVLCAVPSVAEAPIVSAIDAPGTGLRVVRRCADLAEATALAVAGVGRAVVLAAEVQGVDRAAIARLRGAGLGVVLLADRGELERCRALGADAVLVQDCAPEEVVAALQEAQASAAADDAQSPALPAAKRQAPSGASGWPATGDPPALGEHSTQPTASDPARGQVVAVWGPHGAPGRTTVAVNLAAELAALGGRTLLVDADTYGGCVGQALGLLDEAAGLAAAVRSAANGTLDAAGLARLCPVVEPGLRVLTGLSRPDRWRELAPAGLDVVWEASRELADWTVVDCGFSLEEDARAGFEAMLGPRRNGATLSAIASSDVVLAVGAAEPVGLQRLVQGLTELAELGLPDGGARLRVLVNRVRASAAGPKPERAVTEALVRYAGVSDVVLVPDDRPALDRAMLQGVTLRESAPGSPARGALRDLAAELAGGAAPERGRGRRVSRFSR